MVQPGTHALCKANAKTFCLPLCHQKELPVVLQSGPSQPQAILTDLPYTTLHTPQRATRCSTHPHPLNLQTPSQASTPIQTTYRHHLQTQVCNCQNLHSVLPSSFALVPLHLLAVIPCLLAPNPLFDTPALSNLALCPSLTHQTQGGRI